jgi:hypothetical protein
MPLPTLRLAPVTIATLRSKRGAIQAFFVLMLWLLGNDLGTNANGKSRMAVAERFIKRYGVSGRIYVAGLFVLRMVASARRRRQRDKVVCQTVLHC